MRIGIIGNGMIVRRMLQDIKGISEIELSAICVRAKSLEKGRDLAEEFGIPAVDTDYRTFLEREDMDTVYIGIVNQMHDENLISYSMLRGRCMYKLSEVL